MPMWIGNAAHEWAILDVVEKTPAALMDAAIHQALGMAVPLARCGAGPARPA